MFTYWPALIVFNPYYSKSKTGNESEKTGIADLQAVKQGWAINIGSDFVLISKSDI